MYVEDLSAFKTLSLCIYSCMYVCMYVCMCISVHLYPSSPEIRMGVSSISVFWYPATACRIILFDLFWSCCTVQHLFVRMSLLTVSVSVVGDSSAALVLDDKYVKAYSRRGLVRFKRGKYLEVRYSRSLPVGKGRVVTPVCVSVSLSGRLLRTSAGPWSWIRPTARR